MKNEANCEDLSKQEGSKLGKCSSHLVNSGIVILSNRKQRGYNMRLVMLKEYIRTE